MKSACVIEVAAEVNFGWSNKASFVLAAAMKQNESSKERNQDNLIKSESSSL